MNRTSENIKVIQATREKVYNAFTDRKALAFWLAPKGMAGKIRDFDVRVGGGYDMSLFYLDNKTAGKTSGNEDRFYAKFTELRPYEKIVQAIHFQTDKKEFTEEMIMEVFLEEYQTNATKVTIIFKIFRQGLIPKTMKQEQQSRSKS